jgi:hypothetical protein
MGYVSGLIARLAGLAPFWGSQRPPFLEPADIAELSPHTVYFSMLIVAACSSETLIFAYDATGCLNPEDHNLEIFLTQIPLLHPAHATAARDLPFTCMWRL